MLRTILLLIALLIVIAIGLVAFGIINLRQEGSGVSIETRNVEVGTTTTNVQLPVVRIEDRQVEVPTVGLEGENQSVNAQ